MFTKFLLKNGPGSPGNTAKVLINQFNQLNQRILASEPNEIYEQIIATRMMVSHSNPHSIYSRLYDLDKVMDFVENDICTLTFLVLFSESETFRTGVRPNRYGDSSFDVVTEVIFEVCKKNSWLSQFDINKFRDKSNKICRLHIYNY
ncbi:hypothetical protein [Epilithonimonas xixisoli]|uniref:Uncharacterized protein n=1 Tax=Epilithonimonas xixisoli TaxID=1476462 RepID=A0A4R8IBY6_9FLAO|nr:hypothetical protein [Epilithonimonas xixisoli]TDX82264.1 hypothetical protein B0I22_3427 [Epilithonimonas xixisoli]